MNWVLIAGTVALLLFAANGEIRRETAQQEASMRATLAKNCPMVWEHILQVRDMPQASEALKWCPEA